MKKKLKNTKDTSSQERKEDHQSKKKEINNCWNCIYHNIDGNYLLGRCNWWFLYEKLDPKEIPNTVIDNGCKFWRNGNDSFHPLLEDIILKLQGVLIDQ